MQTYTFYFAPEGRKVATIQAKSLTAAKQQFYREHPQFKRAKGEIYWEVSNRADYIGYRVTYLNRDGMRTLAAAAQGRHTFATAALAQAHIDAMRRVNSPEVLAMFGTPDTLEIRPCLCYWHGDPKSVWFD